MTPAQRKYDQDLILAMQMMANWIEPRSRKVSLTLKLAAERIEALIAGAQIDQPMSVVTPIQPDKIQPQEDKIQPSPKRKSSPRQHRMERSSKR